MPKTREKRREESHHLETGNCLTTHDHEVLLMNEKPNYLQKQSALNGVLKTALLTKIEDGSIKKSRYLMIKSVGNAIAEPYTENSFGYERNQQI